MARKNDRGFQFGKTRHRGIEVVDFKPEQNAVSIGLVVAIADGAVVMFDLEMMQLEDQLAIADQPLIVRAAVVALAAQEVLIPAAAGLDISDGDHRLRAHETSTRAIIVENTGIEYAAHATHSVAIQGEEHG